jgi:hypothetical protein
MVIVSINPRFRHMPYLYLIKLIKSVDKLIFYFLGIFKTEKFLALLGNFMVLCHEVKVEVRSLSGRPAYNFYTCKGSEKYFKQGGFSMSKEVSQLGYTKTSAQSRIFRTCKTSNNKIYCKMTKKV